MSTRKTQALQTLDDEIEAIELAELEPEEVDEVVERVIAGHSAEAREMRRTRKEVRYLLYRLRTEAEGKGAAASDPGFRAAFEGQPLFKGWRFFASLWDVALSDPMRVVSRDNSEQAEWDAVVAAKYPQLTPEGGIHYPDITVRERVEAEAARRSEEG